MWRAGSRKIWLEFYGAFCWAVAICGEGRLWLGAVGSVVCTRSTTFQIENLLFVFTALVVGGRPAIALFPPHIPSPPSNHKTCDDDGSFHADAASVAHRDEGQPRLVGFYEPLSSLPFVGSPRSVSAAFLRRYSHHHDLPATQTSLSRYNGPHHERLSLGRSNAV